MQFVAVLLCPHLQKSVSLFYGVFLDEIKKAELPMMIFRCYNFLLLTLIIYLHSVLKALAINFKKNRSFVTAESLILL